MTRRHVLIAIAALCWLSAVTSVRAQQYPLAKYFDEAVAALKAQHPTMNSDVQARTYALARQATDGDNKMPRPLPVQIDATQTWNAWEREKGKSREQAKQEYVELVKTLVSKSVGDKWK